MREIAQETVQALLERHDLPADASMTERVWRFLRDRLVSVDAAPKTARGDEAALARIEVAAAELSKALGDYRHSGDLMLSIADDLVPTLGYMDDGMNLHHWLARLAVARQRYFRPCNPSSGYHWAIRQLRDLILDGGGNVAVHATSRFVRFLLAVEAEKPALIFPPETVGTERGRSRYVERALAGQDSTN